MKILRQSSVFLLLVCVFVSGSSIVYGRSAHYGYLQRDNYDPWNENSPITREEYNSIQDVYHFMKFVENTYQAVLNLHGARLPFSTLITTKKKEIKLLETLLDRYAVSKEKVREYSFPVVQIGTWQNALQTAVKLEKETYQYVGGKRTPVVDERIISIFNEILEKAQSGLPRVEEIASAPQTVFVNRPTIAGRGTSEELITTSQRFLYSLLKDTKNNNSDLERGSWLASAPTEGEEAGEEEATKSPLSVVPEMKTLEKPEETFERVFSPQYLEVSREEREAVQEVASLLQFSTALYEKIINQFGARAPFNEIMVRNKREENRMNFLFRRYTIPAVKENIFALSEEDTTTWTGSLKTAQELEKLRKNLLNARKKDATQKYIINTFDFLIENTTLNTEKIEEVLKNPQALHLSRKKLPGRGVEPDAYIHSARYKYEKGKEEKEFRQEQDFWLHSAEKDTRNLIYIDYKNGITPTSLWNLKGVRRR